MSQRPHVRVSNLSQRWERSPFNGGFLGIAAVALATLAVGLVCSLATIIVILIY